MTARWLRRVALALLALLAAIALLLAVVLTRPFGVRMLLDRAGPLIGGELAYESVEGRLVDHWTVTGLSFRQAVAGDPTGLEVTIERLSVRWRPWALTTGVLDLIELEAGGVDVLTAASTEQEGPTDLPDVRLPFAVRVGAASVERVTIRRPAPAASNTADAQPPAGPTVVDRVALRRLSVAPAGGSIEVERLAIRTPEAALQLAGNLRPVGDYAFRLDTAWRGEGAFEDGEPTLVVTGGGELRGSLRRTELDQRVSVRLEDAEPDAPDVLTATVAGVIEEPLGAPKADLEVTWSRLRWPPAGELVAESTGQARVRGDLERIELDGMVRASGPRLPAAELELVGSTDLESLTAEELELRILDSTITGTATVSWREGVSWSARLAGRDLDPSVQWPEWPGNLEVVFAGTGTVDEDGLARTRADVERVRGTLRGYPVAASGGLVLIGENLESLSIDARSGGARLRLAGSYTGRADLELVATIPDLGQVLPDAGGSLEASGRLSGPRDRPVVSAVLAGRDAAFGATRLAVVSGGFDGVIAEGGGARLRLAISQVDTETSSLRDVELELVGTLGGLERTALLERSSVDARIRVAEVVAGAVQARGVELAAEGTLGTHVLTLEAASAGRPDGETTAHSLRVRAAGGASEASLDGRWSGTLAELGLVVPELGGWSLDSELPLELSSDHIEVGQGCWRRHDGDESQPSFVCGRGRWSREGPWTMRAELTAIPLGLLDPLLAPAPGCPGGVAGADVAASNPTASGDDEAARGDRTSGGDRLATATDRPDGCPSPTEDGAAAGGGLRSLSLEGWLDARLRASGDGSSLQRASAQITRLEGSARAVLARGETIEAPFRQGEASLSLDPQGGATARGRLELPAHDGRLAVSVDLPGYSAAGGFAPGEDQTLAGRIEAELHDPGFLEALVPALREPRGNVDADLSLGGTTGRPWLDGRVTVSDAGGRLLLASPPDASEDLELTFAEVNVDALFDRSGGRLELSLRSEDPAGDARGSFELPGLRLVAGDALATQAVSGRLDFALDGIAPLAELLPQLRDVAGQVDGGFAIAGTLGAPELDGRADLRGFSAEIPDLAVELRDGTASIQGTPGESLAVTASVRSGPGTLVANGTVRTADGAWRAEIELDGTDVTVANTPDIRVRASPDLVVTASAEEVHVEGDVELPWARIELRDLPERAIEPSTDVVRVGGPPVTQAQPVAEGPAITGRIRLIFGDDFQFEGFGFDVEPRGSLLITETGRGSTTATGQLALGDGSYRAYGQNLEITEGRVLFGGGAIQNPALAVEAYRTVDSVRAGVRVSGNLEQPIVTLVSTPTMSESDILHYMMLGRAPGAVASASETDLLTRAAASLGIRGGNLLARRLASRYDLDELGIETDGGFDTASLVVGKYLSPRLYVSYGIGLFEPISTFAVRYILSSRWTLLAEKGRGTGADLVYSIETGRRARPRTPP